MKRTKKKYGEPPIREAVYEVFVEERSDLKWTEEFAEQFRSKFEGFTGDVERLHAVEMQVSMRNNEIQQGIRQQPPRSRWWHGEQKRAIQAGPNMCAHNVLSPYGKYEDYQAETKKLFKTFLDMTQPVSVAWTGQRYINEILMPVGTHPAEYFAIYPDLESIGKKHPNMALQVETASFMGGSTVSNLVFRREDESDAVYTLDIYARSSEQIACDADALTDWHQRAHNTISHSFELAITNNARQAFKEQKQ